MQPPALTREQVRTLDRIAIEEYGIPGAVLMENAGAGAARLLLERAAAPAAELRVAILAGPGNNGGDGYVMARHLANAGCAVELYSTATREGLDGDAALNRRIVDRMGLVVREVLTAHQLADSRPAWRRAHVLVDALLGTGFQGQVRPHLRAVIEAVNEVSQPGSGAGPAVCAVDLPSGLDCDTGQPSNATVRASYTLTFAAPKVGLELPAARAWTGPVSCVDIGAPAGLASRLAGVSA